MLAPQAAQALPNCGIFSSGNLPVAGCDDQDKRYENWVTNLDGLFQVSTAMLPTADKHTVTFLPSGGQQTLGGFVEYTISVIQPSALFIDSVDLGSTVTTGPVTIEKFIWTDAFDGTLLAGAPLTSVNGAEPATIAAHNVKLWVRDVITVGNGGQWTNFTNTFTENVDRNVPEPAILTLLGLALAGVGATRLRAKKASA